MIRRVWWIVISYVTRPFCLAGIGLGILFFGLGMLREPTRSNEWTVTPARPTRRLVVDSKATLDAVRKSGRQAEVDGIDLVRLWINVGPRIDTGRGPALGPPDKAFFDILKEFPNLRSVYHSTYGDATGLDQICSLPHLEYLSLDGMGITDLTPLRSLPSLKRVDVGLMAFPKYVNGKPQPIPKMEGIAALAALPYLDTLEFRARYPINDAVLADVARLPHLRVLALDIANHERDPEPAVTAAGFRALAGAPSLRTLYLGGYRPEDYTELAAIARPALPNAWIFSSRYDPATTLLLAAILPCMFLAIAVAAQLSSQFLGSCSRLIPGFVSSHALVAIALSLGIIALAAVRLLDAGLSVLAAIVTAAALVTWIVASLAPLALPANGVREFPHLARFTPLLLFVLVLPFISAFGQPSAMLNSPLAIVANALVACAATGLTAWTLRRLPKWSSGASGLEGRNMLRPAGLRMGGGGRLSFAMSKRERQLDECLLRFNSSVWWQSVRRWQFGNPPFQPVRFAVLWLLLGIATPALVAALWGLRPSIIPGFLPMMTCTMLFSAAVRVGVIWRERLPIMTWEWSVLNNPVEIALYEYRA